MPGFRLPDDNFGPKDLGGPTVASVISKIECEVYQARILDFNKNNGKDAIPGTAPFDQWSANVILTLTVDDTLGLTPSPAGLPLTFIDPLRVPATSFIFAFNPILSQDRERIYTETYTFTVGNTKEAACKRERPLLNLAGDLGLGETIRMGLHSFSDQSEYYVPADPSKGIKDSFGGTAQFIVSKGVSNVGPLWTLVRFKGPGPGGAGYFRKDTNKIAITFAPAKLGGAGRALADSSSANIARGANQQLNILSTLQSISQSLNHP
jgi:hypothetical protein